MSPYRKLARSTLLVYALFMNPSLSAVLFCLVLCAVFVWLAVKRMRAGKPHRVFVWLARFFGVMVVMGVDSICKAEGIILGGLVVVAGAFAVLATVSWVVRELGKRKKAEQAFENRRDAEVLQENSFLEEQPGKGAMAPDQILVEAVSKTPRPESEKKIAVSNRPRKKVKMIELVGFVLLVFGVGITVHCLSADTKHNNESPFIQQMNAVRDLTPQDLEKMNLSPKEKEQMQEVINDLKRERPSLHYLDKVIKERQKDTVDAYMKSYQDRNYSTPYNPSETKQLDVKHYCDQLEKINKAGKLF